MCGTCKVIQDDVVLIGQFAPDGITACPMFETQFKEFCGLHAVRNILAVAGIPVADLPNKDDMDTIAEGLVAIGMAGGMKDLRGERGDYAHPVLAKCLETHGVVMGESQDITNCQAWMVNTGLNGHWFAYVQSNRHWWNVDSLNKDGPQYIGNSAAMTEHILKYEMGIRKRTVFGIHFTDQLFDKVGYQNVSMLS